MQDIDIKIDAEELAKALDLFKVGAEEAGEALLEASEMLSNMKPVVQIPPGQKIGFIHPNGFTQEVVVTKVEGNTFEYEPFCYVPRLLRPLYTAMVKIEFWIKGLMYV